MEDKYKAEMAKLALYKDILLKISRGFKEAADLIIQINDYILQYESLRSKKIPSTREANENMEVPQNETSKPILKEEETKGAEPRFPPKIITKIYKVMMKKPKNGEKLAYRIYVKMFDMSLCLGPYLEKSIAERIKFMLLKKLKKEKNLTPENLDEFFKEFKLNINKKYIPLRMCRKRKFYKGSLRKI